MPLVKIVIIEGKTEEYKMAIFEGIHQALVKAFKIPDDDRIQRLSEISKKNFDVSSEEFTLIEITVFEGRSIDAKRLLYSSIVDNLSQNPGMSSKDILIVLHDVPLVNWGISGGRPASEVDLGFKVDI